MSELACKPFGAWRVGDTVRCVNAIGSGDPFLEHGSEYKITGIYAEASRILLDGSSGYWNHERFEWVPKAVEPAPAVVAEPNPYADWKSGDSVRCLNASASWGMLAEQHVYEIDGNLVLRDDCGPGIHLVGIPSHEWDCNRFERVSPIVDVHSEPDKPVVRVGSRVRCDDDSGPCAPKIVLGEIYTVSAIGDLSDGDTCIGVDGTASLSWKLSRFTLLPDEVAPVVPAKQADLADADLMTADEARRKCDERFMEHCRELRHVAKAAIESAIDGGDASAFIEVPHGDYYPLQRWLSRLGYGLSVDVKKIGCVLARISW